MLVFLAFLVLIFLVVECIVSLKITHTVSAKPYYCFCFQSSENTQEQKESVVSMGGAGVEFVNNGKNFIAVALYDSVETAEVIASKNNGIVQEISLPLLTFSDKKQANDTKESYDEVCFYLMQLVSLYSQYDSGKLNENSLALGIDNYLKFLTNNDREYFPEKTNENFDTLSAYAKFLASDLLFYAIEFFS